MVTIKIQSQNHSSKYSTGTYNNPYRSHERHILLFPLPQRPPNGVGPVLHIPQHPLGSSGVNAAQDAASKRFVVAAVRLEAAAAAAAAHLQAGTGAAAPVGLAAAAPVGEWAAAAGVEARAAAVAVSVGGGGWGLEHVLQAADFLHLVT